MYKTKKVLIYFFIDFDRARKDTPSIEARIQEIAKFRFTRFKEELGRLANHTGDFTNDQLKIFREVFSFWVSVIHFFFLTPF